MPDMSFYENVREDPRVTSSVFVRYNISDETNKSVASGVSTTRDISAGGLKFFCTTPARTGYIVKMQLQLTKFNTIGVLGTVAWVKQPRPGQFLLGVKFENLAQVHLEKIVKFLNEHAPKD